MSETKDIWSELRKPFDSKVIGSLPKPYKKDSPKGKCPECGGYHGLPAVHLDYVGHAAITDRLLTVDPQWTWEPLSLDERGLPQYDSAGGLWITLTIGGVTRLGYGDGPNPKERIGDALRNAAMRFGVALDLWSKDELESHLDAPELKNEKPSETGQEPVQTSKLSEGPFIRPTLVQQLRISFKAARITGDAATVFVKNIIGKATPTNEVEVQQIIAALQDLEAS